MKTKRWLAGGAFGAALIATALIAPSVVGTTKTSYTIEGFSLIDAVPRDVFVLEATRPNPKNAFLDEYWGEVFEELQASGVGEDLLDLMNSMIGAEQSAEIARLREQATRLLDGVDWQQLGASESVFAQRLVPPASLSKGQPPIMMANMVWLVRGTQEGAEKNFEGLSGILEAIAAEVNRAAGGQALIVVLNVQGGADVASLRIADPPPAASMLALHVALREDVIVIGFQDALFNDVLDVMGSGDPARALSADPRFQAAFASLPPGETSMTFFDMKGIVGPMRSMARGVMKMASAPGDLNRNSAVSQEAQGPYNQGLVAYRDGELEQALELTRQAAAIDQTSATLQYNLACFNALAGDLDEAHAALRRAVEAGFHAPAKIAADSDLDILRDDPRYAAALERAAALAAWHRASDTIINTSHTGEAYRLSLQAWQAHREHDYERGLTLFEQALAVAPADSAVLYGIACSQSLLGYEKEALTSLEKAVAAGYYSPRHIEADADLEDLRGHARFKSVVELARMKASEADASQKTAWLTLAQTLLERVTGAMGMLDYSASVGSTDGYSQYAETVAVLAPGAHENPFFKVFAKHQQLGGFDRFLPAETVSFSVAGGLDLGELYGYLEDSFRAAGPVGQDLLAQWGAIQQQFGIDLRKDAFDWIGGDSVNVTLAGGDSVNLIQVSNEQQAREKVGAVIEFLSNQLNDIIAKAAQENPAMAMLGMLRTRTSPCKHAALEGFQNLYIGIVPKPAVWGVAEGHLIIGTSADAVALSLATAKGEHPNIRNNPAIMAEAILPEGPFASISLKDLRGTSQELAGAIGMVGMMSGMAGAAIPEPEVRQVISTVASILGNLTPVVELIDFYKSSAACTTFDGKKWTSRTVTHYLSPEERAAR